MPEGRFHAPNRAPLCPEADKRAAMDDGEFWEHVFQNITGDGPAIEDDYDEVYDTTAQFDPCPVCHERGPCAYDDEGRALVHITEDTDK